MTSSILYFLTRTPLHIGAGSSVGAIDQPIQRERHTNFPIIPASGQKGCFADLWPSGFAESARVEVESKEAADGKKTKSFRFSESAWLFGSDTADLSFAGTMIFSEARILAFPIRSARGGYAWITCPLALQRAARDGVFGPEILTDNDGQKKPNMLRQKALQITEPLDGEAIFEAKPANAPHLGRIDLGGRVVLEEYCFAAAESDYPAGLARAIAALVPDELFASVEGRLVILSNGLMSHFVSTACEVAQHVRINDTTGTADVGGLFNQENVPSDTLFYAVLDATDSRVPDGAYQGKESKEALEAFKTKLGETGVVQLGGDATTGHGYCTVRVSSI